MNISILGLWLICAMVANAQVMSTPKAATSLEAKDSIPPVDEIAIRQIVDKWKDGYNSGNAAGVAALYIEDAYYLTQHFITGIVHGRAAIQAYVQRGVDARYHIDSIQVISLKFSERFAYAITRYESTNGAQKAFGVNLVVLNKIEGRWFIVAHGAAVPDSATAIRQLDTETPH